MGIVSTVSPELKRFVGRPKIEFTDEQDEIIVQLRNHMTTEDLRKKLGGITQGTLYRRIHELGLPVKQYVHREKRQ